MIRLQYLAVASGMLLLSGGCRSTKPITYRGGDPGGEAHRALIDSGHFHLLAVKVGDSVIAPSDTTQYLERSYNVEVAPEGGIVFLPIDPNPDRPGWPSEAQVRYLTQYNTTLFALLDTNAMPPLSLPNQRLKLPRR